MIAAAFGLIYVVVNAGPLPTGWTLTLRVLAVVAFVVVLAAVFGSGVASGDGTAREQRVFGRGYWSVVGAEFVALFLGARVLSGPLHAPQAGVAWVSTVVGVHFFALAAFFGERFYYWVGGVITVCGVVGLLLAVAGAEEPTIALVSGVLPGAVLLGFGWWGAHRTETTTERPDSVSS